MRAALRKELLSMHSIDLVGAITANAYMLIIIFMFAMRIAGQHDIARWVGWASSIVIFPLAYLLVAAFQAHRPPIYFIWLGLMILFALFELVIDDILAVDFRGAQWSVILYVMFFFAATGGMIGVASQAGRPWSVVTGSIFLVMAALAFISRRLTGI